MADQQYNPFNVGGSYGPGLSARPPRADNNFATIRQLENQGRAALNRAKVLRAQYGYSPLIGHVSVALDDNTVDVLYDAVPGELKKPAPVMDNASLVGLDIDEIMELLIEAGLKDKSRIDGIRNHLVKGLITEEEPEPEPEEDANDPIKG